MRGVFKVQMICLFVYGAVSGAAFSAVLETRVHEAETRVAVSMILHVPMRELSEIRI